MKPIKLRLTDEEIRQITSGKDDPSNPLGGLSPADEELDAVCGGIRFLTPMTTEQLKPLLPADLSEKLTDDDLNSILGGTYQLTDENNNKLDDLIKSYQKDKQLSGNHPKTALRAELSDSELASVSGGSGEQSENTEMENLLKWIIIPACREYMDTDDYKNEHGLI